jgi:PAS domain S-box-containing protein
MPQDIEGADHALRDLRSRLGSLRDARGAPSVDERQLLDVALAELDRATEKFAEVVDLLHVYSDLPHSTVEERDKERELLRRLFLASPVPVLLMAASGEIRRGNRAAGDLFDLPLGYLTGKPFYALLDPATVAMSRARLAAALRSGERQSMVARVRHTGGLVNVSFVVQPFSSPGKREPELLVVAGDIGQLPVAEVADDREGRYAERSWQTAQALDLTFSCAAALLEAVQRTPKEAERMVAERLTVDFADWVLVDCLEHDNSLRRAGVSGPDTKDDLVRLLMSQEGDDNLAARTVLSTGEPVLHVHPPDPALLGTLPDGRTLIGAVNGGSLLAVPFGYEDRMVGVLSAVRAADRAYFTLTDQRVCSEIAGLLGLSIAIRDMR